MLTPREGVTLELSLILTPREGVTLELNLMLTPSEEMLFEMTTLLVKLRLLPLPIEAEPSALANHKAEPFALAHRS